MKKIQALWIIVFMGILLLPNALQWMAPDGMGALQENRALSKAPTLSFNNVLTFASEFENYYNDHLPFKGWLVKTESLINKHLFRRSITDHVIIGKNNWFFYSRADDGNAMENYKGMDHYSQQALESMALRWSAIHERLAEKGIELQLFMAPNKEAVYDEYMPSYIRRVSRQSGMDQSFEYLQKHTLVSALNMKSILREMRYEAPVYFQLDTHWNDLGGFIGAQTCLENLRLPSINWRGIRYQVESEREGGDLADLLGMKDVLKEYCAVTIQEPRYHDINPTYDDANRITYFTGGTGTRRALVIHDSFGVAMMPYLAHGFAQTIFVHSASDGLAKGEIARMLHDGEIDVVIIEMVERYGHNFIYTLDIESWLGIDAAAWGT